MVAVRVRYQHRVYVPDVVGEALRAEVGARVDYDDAPLRLHKHRTPQTLVAWVARSAYRAVAVDYRNAKRRPCSQKFYLHGNVFLFQRAKLPKILPLSMILDCNLLNIFANGDIRRH
jgi:hypothetical protein